MIVRARFVGLVMAAACLVGLSAFISGQAVPPTPPQVIFGNDVGFRPDAVQRTRDRVTGTFVVRINGQWVEAQFSARPTPARH